MTTVLGSGDNAEDLHAVSSEEAFPVGGRSRRRMPGGRLREHCQQHHQQLAHPHPDRRGHGRPYDSRHHGRPPHGPPDHGTPDHGTADHRPTDDHSTDDGPSDDDPRLLSDLVPGLPAGGRAGHVRCSAAW